jgi:phosphoesterase RecJ-like protein
MHTDQILRKIKEIVDTAKSILITGQANPDGDSIGSQLALYDILGQHKRHAGTAQNLEIVIANDQLPPPHYQVLPRIQIVTPVEQILSHRFDVSFILDASKERIVKTLPLVQKCQYTINIDHHRNRAQSEETVAWIDPDMSSVAEMIYSFLEHPAWQVTLNADIAACLYAAIVYDTGSFRYPSTTARTHQIAAKLLETGIDFARITERMLLEKPFSAMQLFGAVLHTLHRDSSGEIIWGMITQKLLKQVNARPDEDEGIISHYTFTKGAKVAVLFKEISANKVKVSFRSRGAVDVGQFARSLHPNGGGHQRAAGCLIAGTIDEVKDSVIQALQEELRTHTDF